MGKGVEGSLSLGGHSRDITWVCPPSHEKKQRDHSEFSDDREDNFVSLTHIVMDKRKVI
jgi:hypothetical protein